MENEEYGKWGVWKVRSMENEEYGKWGVWKVRSMENEEYGKCGVWKVRSMENEEYGKCGVWKVRSMESAEYGKWGVWKMRSMESAEYGKWGVWKMRSMESAEYGKWGVWKMRSMESAEYGKWGVWKVRSMENEEYGKWGVWKMRSMENVEYGKCGVWKMWSMESAEYGKCGSDVTFIENEECDVIFMKNAECCAILLFFFLLLFFLNFVSHSCQSGVLWYPVAAWNFPGRAGHFGELGVMRWIMAFKLSEFEGIFEASHRKLAPVPVVWALREGRDWKRGLWLGIVAIHGGAEKVLVKKLLSSSRSEDQQRLFKEARLFYRLNHKDVVKFMKVCVAPLSNDAWVRQKNWRVNCTTLRIFHKNYARLHIFHTPHFPSNLWLCW